MSRKRKVWIALGSLAAVALLAVTAGILVLQSSWFYEKVRQWTVNTVETATGGRAEIGSFHFDWKRLRAEVRGFVLHGTEPADKPPLLRAASVAVGLRIVSVFKRDVDIQYLDVVDPRVNLIVSPDGRTNIPEPKVKRPNAPNAVDTILNLAIGRFSLENGLFEVESRGRTPFDARGENLNAKFTYERTPPLPEARSANTAPQSGNAGAVGGGRYRGDISIQPLHFRWPPYDAVPFGVNLAVTVERNRIGITSGKLTTAASQVEFSGAIDNFTAPHASFEYRARVAVPDAGRILRERSLDAGAVESSGNATWSEAAGVALTGSVRGNNLGYHDRFVRLSGFRLDGALKANGKEVELSGARLSGSYATAANKAPVDGRIDTVTLRGRDLDLRGVSLATLGGSFQGAVRLADLDRYHVEGEISGIEAKRGVAMYSPVALPWDARVSGPVKLDGSLKRPKDLRLAGDLAIAPAPVGAPVHGQITASYDASTGILDLGRSNLTLPATRVDFSGAIGRELQVHAETRDLNDILPALGQKPEALPFSLDNGAAIFDGKVTGKLERPQIAGRLNVTSFSIQGRHFDSLAGDVTASSSSLAMKNAAAARGTWRAQFQGAVALNEWKADDARAISGTGTVQNAPAADLAALLNLKDLPATGTVSATAEISGTLGDARASGDIDVTKGTVQGEPFDRFTAHVTYSAQNLDVAAGQLTAGAKQVRLTASYNHAPRDFENGRLRFQISTNSIPLDQVKRLQETRPGIEGAVSVTANGEVDLSPARNGVAGWRIAGLHADVNAQGLQLTGQALGNAHLTANSQGQALRAHLESDFANSGIRGDGEWSLEGDYPGTATVAISKLDFTKLRAWVAPAKSNAAASVAGSAEGELHIDGPLLKPELLKAQLRLSTLEFGPAPNTSLAATVTALKNDGPVVASLSNKAITIESARLKGRGTDVTVSGKVTTDPKSPLDLRANGRIDLAILHDFNRDLAASGMVNAEANVRGAFSSPQITGRMQFDDASLNIVDFPNGISKATGEVLFTGDRATIQRLRGETGGGKIEISGFVSYGGGATLFGLHANAEQVRVRYPEGVSTVSDTNLTLSGTTDRSLLSGTVTVRRTGVNLQSDFSSLLSRSAEPIRTPSSRTGLLGGMDLDVQIQTAPDIQFQSSLTQDIQVEANLKLRGTQGSPALLGRINITQGQVLFYGTKYTINQGSIAFYNPLKIEPVLNIDLETRARGVDVTLTVSGPLSHLSLNPRSDPPLQVSEIVALLATGRTPTSDPTLLTQQSALPSFQQAGPTALLGQAIASPVSGRLQRFFGVSNLRIDPTLPGVESSLQARLTLEQQVTPEITVTYITNVTNSNPQVVRAEWAWSKRWSVVLLREENGMIGVDFFFKRRF